MLLYLLFFISTTFAEDAVLINQEDFSFNHPTCLIRFDSNQEFASEIASNLKEKGFKLQDYLPEGKLNPEDMYLKLIIEREGWFYKDCLLDLVISQANSIKPLSSDLRLMSAKVKRMYPRVTFSGDERCSRGIDDLFVNIPKCRSGRLLKNKR
ncbi:MAG: hypothetical protein CME71_01705 [Halobacteriovorax sp.]|nr:hypothetical protein [Halobacteriovorax sp.]|tara:strand:+ start:1090 stop:1548 length:459 start_codon:yes stop_codon:yes gene_type:complete